MKIVIIGTSGQLGTDCCDLLGREHETVGCDIPSVDISNHAAVDEYLDKQRPDVIVNCAAYTAVDACEEEVELAWRVNRDGPRHLAQAARRQNCRLIHVSTDYVFDGNLEPPRAYDEDAIPNPLSQYGKSKLAGEQEIAATSCDHLILRTAWLYSAYGKNFPKTMLRLALADPKRELKVVSDQYGSLTWSRTLARQIGQVLGSDLQGIAHATATGYSTWYEAACYFLDSMEVKHSLRPCTTSEYPTPAHRPANSILANTRLEAAGLSVFTSWQEDVDAFVNRHGGQLLLEARGLIQAG